MWYGSSSKLNIRIIPTFLLLLMSQTLFGNPKGPVELGNPNTCAETKLYSNFILFWLKKLSAMSLKLLYRWFKRKFGLFLEDSSSQTNRDHCL